MAAKPTLSCRSGLDAAWGMACRRLISYRILLDPVIWAGSEARVVP